jgi:hypothetical protein
MASGRKMANDELSRTPLLKKIVLRGKFDVMGVCEHNPSFAHRTK